MENDRESSSTDRRGESSSGNGGTSEGSNEDSSSRIAGGRRAPPQHGGGVPQYVDMVIPDYESRLGRDGRQQDAQGNGEAGAAAAQRERENQEAKEESLSAESQKSYRSSEDSMCIPTDNDVLLNESGDHPGNLRYRAVVRHLAKKYTKVKLGYRRAAVQILVNAVKAQGGRFLKCNREGKWEQVSDRKAYAKSSQAIRGTCRKIEIVASRRDRKSSGRRHHGSANGPSRQESSMSSSRVPRSNSETSSYQPTREGRSGWPNLETIALRLQTMDEKLKHLYLDLQTVNHEFIFPFAKALDANKILTSLEIDLSHMNRTNANALAWGVKRCAKLKQIKLSYGKLSEKSSIVLAGVLDNPSIESLNLDSNDIDTEHLKVICRMITQAKTCRLRRISLENNTFTDDGASVLSKLILHSKTLRFFNFAGCNLQANGVSLILSAAEKRSDCLIEVSGLDASGSRKRPAVPSSEDSEEAASKKPRSNKSASPPISETVASNPMFAGSQNQTSSTSSSNETEPAPSSSDNAPSNDGSNGGTDEGPASSMNDSDGSPSSAST